MEIEEEITWLKAEMYLHSTTKERIKEIQEEISYLEKLRNEVNKTKKELNDNNRLSSLWEFR